MSRVVKHINEALGLSPKRGKRKGSGFTQIQRSVIRKVVDKLRQGESKLGRLLDLGYSMYAVIAAIKAQKCIANLGSTYLEQTIAGCIRDLIKEGSLRATLVDKYRSIFGLPPVSHVDDEKQKPKVQPQVMPSAMTTKINKALGIGHVR